MSPRNIMLTAALPYANSSIHIGHVLEYLQADIWARFQKLRGNQCYYICADDTHGTAIMVEARKKNITPEKLIEGVWQEHTKDFKDFEIQFDHYSSTNSDENKKLCEFFFKHMSDKNHIATKQIEQLFCQHDKMFLPDRFVKGICPKCGSKDQYGDSCDVCASTYSPKDMKDPYCSVCGNKPVLKNAEHLLFKLSDFQKYLEEWLPGHTSKEIANKMKEWFNEPLRDWDISRDDPYFGFEIPGYKGKYFYVWVDAPMGYLASFQQYCKKNSVDFEEFWKNPNTKSERYHFIGKDIAYFHTLFWPALLKTAEFNTPTKVFVHGHVKINGEKMSKSKGTQVNVRTYLNHLSPTYLRYYYATRLTDGVDDIDLNFEDFTSRVNSELIGKITNLASRGGQMLGKKLDGIIGELDAEGLSLIKQAQARSSEIENFFENREYAKAVGCIREIADSANRYFDEKAPWKTIDADPTATKKVLSTTLNLFRIIAIYLKPVLPSYVADVEALFNEKPYVWSDTGKILNGHKINDYKHLLGRIETESITKIVEETKARFAAVEAEKNSGKKGALSPTVPTSTQSPGKENRNDSNTGLISFQDFEKVDLRVAKVIQAEEIKEADKLLRLKVDLGPLGEKQIIAGIKAAYPEPAKLIGRLILVVANLEPRKMKFGMSEGMVAVAGSGGSQLFILSPDQGANAGDKVK